MITGAHVIVYSQDAAADRAFFRDVLGFRSIDAGGGWLIFALPPAEAAVHPGGSNGAGCAAPRFTKRRGDRGPGSGCRAAARSRSISPGIRPRSSARDARRARLPGVK